MTNPDRIMTHRMLLTEVWGGIQGTDQHYLHVYVGQFRRKLDPTGSEPRHIVTEPGVGYSFVARPQPPPKPDWNRLLTRC